MRGTPHPLLGLSTFLGTVIGVGVFALPAVAAQMGVAPFLGLLVILAVVLAVLDLQHADLALSTEGQHRTPGYVALYLGQRWKGVAAGVSMLGLLGALLAYCIVGSTFLRLMVSRFVDLPQMVALLVFALIGGSIIARGTRGVAKADLVLLTVFVLIIISFLVLAAPRIVPHQLQTAHFESIPQGYGVVMFALWGLSSIPAVVDISRRSRRRVVGSVVAGLGIATVLYALFVISVVGVNGAATTPDALTGFVGALGARWNFVVGLLGFATTLTSFITLGTILKSTMTIDLRMSPRIGFTAAVIVPFLIVAAGLRSFTSILGFTGSLLLACEALLLLAAARRMQKERGRPSQRFSTLCIRAMLVFGIVLELWYLLVPLTR